MTQEYSSAGVHISRVPTQVSKFCIVVPNSFGVLNMEVASRHRPH